MDNFISRLAQGYREAFNQLTTEVLMDMEKKNGRDYAIIQTPSKSEWDYPSPDPSTHDWEKSCLEDLKKNSRR